MKNVIIIPTYNEKKNIDRLVEDIFSILPEVCILVVDDNSPDKTYERVGELQKSYRHLLLLRREKKEGLGKAYLDAFKYILEDPQLENIIMMDADYSHDPRYLPQLFCEAGHFDVVIGSRYILDGGTEGWELWRKLLSRFGNYYSMFILKMPIFDCTSGFNLIKADFLRKLDLAQIDASGYAFQIELKYLLWIMGAHIKEIPIIFKKRVCGESKICGHIIHEGILAPWKIRKKKTSPSCVGCGDTNAVSFLRKNNCEIYKCLKCGLLFVWPQRNFQDIYAPDYFNGASQGFGYVNYEQDKQMTKEIFNSYLNEIEAVRNIKDTILDVGAATGVFLECARSRGWQTEGVELSDYAVEKAREKGLNVARGTIVDLADKENYFGVITYLDVLEHLPDARSELKMARKLLKDGGILVINTPDAGSFFSRICGRHWHLFTPPEHLIFFNSANLKKMLEEENFKVLLIEKIGKRFTLRYIFQTLANNQNFFIWQWLAGFFKKSSLGKLAIPLNLRDNIFVVAQKYENN